LTLACAFAIIKGGRLHKSLFPLPPIFNLGDGVFTFNKNPGHPSRFTTREDAMPFSAGFLLPESKIEQK